MMKKVLLIITILAASLVNAQNFGNSILMDGLNNYIEVPNDSNLNQTQTITIEAWVNPCDTHFILISKNRCGGNNGGYHFSILNNRLSWSWVPGYCNTANTRLYQSNNIVTQKNVWQHIAVVHTPSSVTLYVNGVSVPGSLNPSYNLNYSTINTSNEPLRIGSGISSSGTISAFYTGSVDEVRIWNYDVSAADILARYNSQLAGNETGLVAYYNMNTISGPGAGMAVVNNATATGSALDGTTFGNVSTPQSILFSNAADCGGVIDSSIIDPPATCNCPEDEDWLTLAGSTPFSVSDDIYTEGKVGINTNNPQGRLHIIGLSQRDLIIESDSNNPDVLFAKNGNINSQIVYRYNPNNINKQGLIIKANNAATGYQPNLGAADLFISGNNDGNVGIGTANPKQKLDVNGNGRFRDLPDASNDKSNNPNFQKVVVVQNNGVLRWVDASSLCCTTLGAKNPNNVQELEDRIAKLEAIIESLGVNINEEVIEKNDFSTVSSLEQNKPNPFSDKTTIAYELKESGYVTLEIFNQEGSSVDMLVNSNKEKGKHTSEWKPNNLPSGAYNYILKVNGYLISKKALYIK